MTPAGEEALPAIREMLASYSTMALGTTSPGASWVATVFYASDERLRLFFVSDPRTRHGRDLEAEPRASAAINADVSTWDDVRGLQLTGTVTVLAGPEREEALAAYLDKFPDVRRLFESPRDESERVIGARLRGANFYALVPDWIRLIDNRNGFGWKREIRFPPDV
ncbi:MAG: pyridoxamine 5'-phosphate oxidase family protein [Chromatiales bacterium]|nr:pyridoxamine 5'-phosphate oxidase family protein [Chromatiales bacterium]